MTAEVSLPSPPSPHSPAYSDPDDAVNLRPKRASRKPKVFTYDTLGTPSCYSIQTLPYYTGQTMPGVYSVHPCYFHEFLCLFRLLMLSGCTSSRLLSYYCIYRGRESMRGRTVTDNNDLGLCL